MERIWDYVLSIKWPMPSRARRYFAIYRWFEKRILKINLALGWNRKIYSPLNARLHTSMAAGVSYLLIFSKGRELGAGSELEFTQRHENSHRNKVCKFKHYYSRKLQVLRSTEISYTFLYKITYRVTSPQSLDWLDTKCRETWRLGKVMTIKCCTRKQSLLIFF